MAEDEIDWTATPEPVVREILAQGQLFMQAQLQSAIASDQRATTMATILLTGATAVFAAIVALDKISGDGSAGLLAMAITLLIAAAAAAWAARPIDFYYPGLRPEQLYTCRLGRLENIIGGAAEEVQRAIDENEAAMDKSQECVRAAFVLAFASPVIGALIWWLA